MSLNWKKIFEVYKGKWVVLKEDEATVISSGKTAREALIEAEKKGYSKPILTQIPR